MVGLGLKEDLTSSNNKDTTSNHSKLLQRMIPMASNPSPLSKPSTTTRSAALLCQDPIASV